MTQTDERFAPPSQAPVKPASGCGWKIPGCTLGCAAVVGVVVLGLGLFAWWLLGPGTQHPTGVAVGPESTGSFEIRDLSEDEDARAALDAVVREVQRRAESRAGSQRGAETPSWFPTDDSALLSAVIARTLPRAGTISFEPIPGHEEPVLVVALNLRGLTRPLRRFLEGRDADSFRYRGVTVVGKPDTGSAVAMVDGTLVLAEHPEALRRAVDRFLDGTGEPTEGRLAILESPSGGALLAGGTDFEPGELTAALAAEQEETGEPPRVDPDSLAGVRRVELVVDHLAAEAIRFRVGVDTDSPAAARRAAPAFAELLDHELEGADLEVTSRIDGSKAILDARLSSWIEPFAASLVGGETKLPAEAAPPREGSD